jgi:hypothetical protein
MTGNDKSVDPRTADLSVYAVKLLRDTGMTEEDVTALKSKLVKD